ncbi:transposase [Streptomyces sp. NPDC002467]|uniref:transposase n=1 Tax=Streptomyces sp. NPDC002467 TaxID=3364647 RepID=UPI00369564A2
MPGRKRHIAVDCLGLLPAVMVTAANVTDRDAAMPLLERVRARHRRIVLVWADGSYAGQLGEAATGARSGDRRAQRRRLGVRGAAQTPGGGTHAELADAIAAPGARLRDAVRRARADGAVVDDDAHEPPAGPAASANRPGVGSGLHP